MDKVSVSVANQEACGLDFNISPIKYDNHPQVMMQVMSTDPKQQLPVLSLSYEINGASKRLEFVLPIFTNKFLQRVDMD
jgi:AP-2 complex subunit alpha